MTPSDAARQRAAAQLLIRLQVADPGARVYCVTEPRHSDSCLRVVATLTEAMREMGDEPCVIAAAEAVAAQGSADIASLRETLRSGGRRTIVSAGALLDSPQSVLAAASSDLVVLVARRGRTRRADVDEARRVLDAAGARLATAVLLE